MTRLEFYVDDAGFHRWRIRAGNGEIVAASSEGFATKQKAEENYRLTVTPPDTEAGDENRG